MSKIEKCKVIMLPQNKSYISIGDLCKYPKIAPTNDTSLMIANEDIVGSKWIAQHLCLINNDKIEKNDLFYHSIAKKIFKATDADIKNIEYIGKRNIYAFKIIATTDITLKLPLIPKEWILNNYIPKNGNINDVDVLMDPCTCSDYFSEGICDYFSTKYMCCTKHKLKLTTNNEVEIIYVDDNNDNNNNTNPSQPITTELKELKCEIVKMLLNTKTPDETYIVKDNRKFSRKQLAEEIENDTPDGKNIVKSLILLTTELVIRGKETLRNTKKTENIGCILGAACLCWDKPKSDCPNFNNTNIT